MPPATSAGTQRWDYLCLNRDYEMTLTEQAKAAGREGWEMVSAGEYQREGRPAVLMCFKRPL